LSTTSQRYAVFSIRESNGKSVWVRAGSAWRNKDGSMNVYLDVLPIDGKLHIREALPDDFPAGKRPNADGSKRTEE
jgi:hypothetical protein